MGYIFFNRQGIKSIDIGANFLRKQLNVTNLIQLDFEMIIIIFLFFSESTNTSTLLCQIFKK